MELILTEIDTLPDFIKYLNIREILYSEHRIIGETNELDLLALYKTRLGDINDTIEQNIILNVVSGYWEKYHEIYAKEITQRNEDNKCSYFIDDIIEYLHKAIGTEHLFEDEFPNANSLEQYFFIVSELAGFDRLTRRNLAEKFIQKMEKADKNSLGSYCLELLNDIGIVLYSSSKPRAERFIFLSNLASCAYCKFNLKKIIGISTDNASATSHSFEFIFYENMLFDDYDELCTLAKELFKSPIVERHSEYNSK